MEITVVKDIDSFSALKDEWNVLLERSGNSTLFLRWEWVFFYCTHMCRDQELLVLLVTNAKGKLVGVAPFVLGQGKIVTKRTFLEIIGQRYSYYIGIIAERDCRDDVYGEVLAYLSENRQRWDLIDFIHLSDDDGFAAYLKDHWPSRGCSLRESTADTCKVVPLKGDFEEYLSSLDEGFAKKLRYYLRSLNRDHHVQLAVPTDEESLQVYWRTFLDLHQTRVHSKGGQTVLSNPCFQEFYYCVARAAYSDNRLRLVALKLDGEIAAVLFGIIWHTTFYFLNIGYKEYSKYSLGLTLPALCIDRAIKDRLQYFDFLGGGGDYKAKMGGVDKGGLHVQVVKRTTGWEQVARRIGGRIVRKVRRW